MIILSKFGSFAAPTRRRTEHHLLHQDFDCTRREASTLSPCGFVEDSKVSASRSKHVPGGSTNCINHGNISSNARSCTAKNQDVDVDDEEEVDMDGEDTVWGKKPSQCWWPGHHVLRVGAHDQKCGSCPGAAVQRVMGDAPLLARTRFVVWEGCAGQLERAKDVQKKGNITLTLSHLVSCTAHMTDFSSTAG